MFSRAALVLLLVGGCAEGSGDLGNLAGDGQDTDRTQEDGAATQAAETQESGVASAGTSGHADGGAGSGSGPSDGAATQAGSAETGCAMREFWPDMDGDGFGDASAAPTPACTAPADHVDNAEDCDDSTADRAPDVVETCDGLDNDCDAAIDEHSAENTASCDDCVHEAYMGHSYAFCSDTELENWGDARERCVALGGDLTSVADEAENAFISDHQLQNGGSFADVFWIGLNDRDTEDTFVWSDGDASAFRAWGQNQPDSGLGNIEEDCTMMWTGFMGMGEPRRWNDDRCGNQNVDHWVCEVDNPVP